MNEFIPYILLLIWWHPDHPGKFEIERRSGAFESLEECQKHGVEAVEGRKIYKQEYGGTEFYYKCIASSSNQEQEDAWANVMERLEYERAERDKEEAEKQKPQTKPQPQTEPKS